MRSRGGFFVVTLNIGVGVVLGLLLLALMHG